MSSQSKHNAAGQMAGYLFQPERALHHLAIGPRGAMVGLETLDDVAVVLANGQQIREQDKHYTSKKKPLADRSKEFWNSLLIWLQAIETEELDTEKTEFHLVTNQTLRTGLAFDLMHLGESNEEVNAFVARLRESGKTPPVELRGLFAKVLAYSDKHLITLLSRIRVFDATSAVHGAELREALHDHLHLPPAHATDIIQGLFGWLNELVLDQIRNNKPAWITRTAFDERYMRLLYHYQDIAFVRETEEALIPVGEDERAKRKNQLFVKQLMWIGCSEEDDDNEILDAIDAHIRSGSEAARLSQEGVVTLEEFRAFDERLVKLWKNLRRIHFPKPVPQSEVERQTVGRTLLNQALNHREMLAGQQTNQFYLTAGAYHRLANDADGPARIGWHPNYTDKIKELLRLEEKTHVVSNRS
ncbi:hypothetical protein AYO41_05375 [Verrucomicrobia bacterium SCGC AG-212-E04]|nr:hypothetical protein AYO41_05375 [Verrucomicrobia bacterium SCGC AG-212-E04]